MPDDNVVKMVDSLADGDMNVAQGHFKNALSNKIGQALDDKRQSVAQGWLNAGDELEATKDAAGLDKVSGAVSTPLVADTQEPEAPVQPDEGETETTPEVETQADQPQDDSNEQPAV